MYLAIEYLVRKGLVREWFNVPCSLFLSENGTPKIAVTINEEFKPSPYYCVKHWNVRTCNKNQALPSFAEFRVPKIEVFSHQAVIVPDHRLMKYHVSPIPFGENQHHHPMLGEVYHYFFDNYLNSFRHKEEKVNWLWHQFLLTYMPQLCGGGYYIPLYKSDAEIASDQRSMVAALHSDVWQCWVKWCKYMLYLNNVPGELIFFGEYRRCQGGTWTEKSSRSSSLLFLP